MADITQNVVLTLALKDQVSASSAKATAAVTAFGEASKAAAEKANAAARAQAATSAATDAELIARSSVRAAGRTGNLGDVQAAAAELAQARAATAEAKEAQAAAVEAARVARSEEASARSAVTAAEREATEAAKALEASEAKASATSTAAAEKQAVAVRAATEAAAGLTREQQVQQGVIDGLSARIGELQARRATADGEAAVSIDREMAGLRRSVVARQDDALAIDVKVAKLREVAGVAAATGEEEVATIRAATDARLVELNVLRDTQRAAVAGVVSPAEDAEGAEAGGGLLASLGVKDIASLVAFTKLNAAIGSVTSKFKESVAAARESQEAQDRLRASLGENVGVYGDVAAAAATAAGGTRFTADQLTAVAERLSARGVPVDQLAKAMRVAADTSTALHKPIEDVADQIAQTFGGTVPRDLKHAVSGLADLTEGALSTGAALDKLDERFGGRALADALTPTGQQVTAAKDLAEAWKGVGQALLPVVQRYQTLADKAATAAVSAVGQLAQNGGAGAQYAAVDLARSAVSMLPGQGSADLASTLNRYNQAQVQAEIAQEKAAASAQLAVDGKAARQQVSDLEKDIAGATAAFDADQSSKHLKAVQQEVAEEARLRRAGIEDSLAAIDRSAAAERDPLKARLTDLGEQAGSAAGTSDAAAARGNAAPFGSNEQNQAAVDEAAALSTIRGLQGQILTIRSQIADVDRRAADERAKAIDETGKQVAAESSAAGQKLRGQLAGIGETDGLNPLDAYAKGAAAANDYRRAIAAANAELDKLIARAADPAERAKLADIKLHVDVDAQKTMAEVHTLAGDVHEALQQPLAGAFDRMIDTQGSFTHRLRAGAEAFLESITQMVAKYAAQMAANAVLTGLLGPVSAPVATGGGAPQPVQQLGTGLIGTAFGGIGKAVASGAGSVASGIGSEVSGIAGVLGNLFAEGGHTGDGDPRELAGVVHKGEYVLHSRAVQRYGVGALDRMNAGHLDALAGLDGRMAGGGVPSMAGVAIDHGANGPQLGVSAGRPASGVGPGGGHTVTPGFIVGEQMAEQLAGSPALQRRLAQQQLQNPSVWGPVHRAYGK